MSTLEFTLRLLAAFAGGMAIGFERQWFHKSAGLRTNTLVSVGAAIFVLLSIMLTQHGDGDVTRIVGQVVTGSGFLCAGIIFRAGITVHGLTTAVTVWCCSAVGCLAAAGYFELCLITTALIITINLCIKPLDEWLMKRSSQDLDNSSS